MRLSDNTNYTALCVPWVFAEAVGGRIPVQKNSDLNAICVKKTNAL